MQSVAVADNKPGALAPDHGWSWVNSSLDSFIAIFTAGAISVYLVGWYGYHSPAAVVALYAALLLGGIPILVRLLVSAVRLEFGSDLLAGFSIVTAALLKEYLVAA